MKLSLSCSKTIYTLFNLFLEQTYFSQWTLSLELLCWDLCDVNIQWKFSGTWLFSWLPFSTCLYLDFHFHFLSFMTKLKAHSTEICYWSLLFPFIGAFFFWKKSKADYQFLLLIDPDKSSYKQAPTGSRIFNTGILKNAGIPGFFGTGLASNFYPGILPKKYWYGQISQIMCLQMENFVVAILCYIWPSNTCTYGI